jgi:nucleoside-diphosphate-sugar epimerase
LPLDKKLYIFRPAMIHGPGNKGNLNLLYSVVSKGIPWPLASFDNKRSFVSIDNLCFVFRSIIDGDIESGTYNIADDDSISTTELIRIISRGVGNKPRLWFIPRSFISKLARLGDVLHLPLNSERLHKLTENYVVSNNKLKSILKTSLPVSVSDGLLLTIRSFNIEKNKK